MTAPTSAGFNDALRLVAGVEGWMTDDQARRLWDRAAEVRSGGQIVEIGSYRGRSAIVLARAAGGRASVVAIDPHAGNDRGPQQIHGTVDEGETDNHAFVTNLRRAGVSDQVRHVRLPSQDAGREISGPIDMLYIDGNPSDIHLTASVELEVTHTEPAGTDPPATTSTSGGRASPMAARC